MAAQNLGSEAHTDKPAEGEVITDKELLEYFAPMEQSSVSGGPQDNELSVILTHIEEVIDCLMSLIPSIGGGRARSLTGSTISTDMQWPGEFERYTRLIQRFFPGVDDVISGRLTGALTWRRSCLNQFSELPNSKVYPMKGDIAMKLTK